MNLNKYITKDIDQHIPSLKGYNSISQIRKGYSNDDKLYRILEDNNYFDSIKPRWYV